MTAYRVGAEPLRELGERCGWRHRLRWRAPNGRSAPGNATDPAVGTDLALVQPTAELSTAASHAAGLRGHRVGDEHVRLERLGRPPAIAALVPWPHERLVWPDEVSCTSSWLPGWPPPGSSRPAWRCHTAGTRLGSGRADRHRRCQGGADL